MQIPSMPFKIFALAPFNDEENPWSEDPIVVDNNSIDRAMENLGVTLNVSVPRDLFSDGELEVTCKQFKDFHPDGLVQSNAFLKNLADARHFVGAADKQGLSSDQIAARLRDWPNLPPMHIRGEKQTPRKSASSPVDDILNIVALPEENRTSSSGAVAVIDQIDALLGQTLGHVFSSEAFRRLESAWQGLKCLIDQGQGDGHTQIKVVPVNLDTLDETLANLNVTLVNDVPSLILVDLPFNNTPSSLECLERIAGLAETLLSPAVCWVTHDFLHLPSWNDLDKLSFLPHYLDEPSFAKWRNLAGTPSARWLAVSCNRFLTRYPYGPDNKPRLASFHESGPLWISPVWAIGALASQSHAKTGWPTRFTDWQRIRLNNLPLDTRQANKPIATEMAIAETRIDQFARAGITPLVGYRNQDIAFVVEEATVAKGSLRYQLFLSRLMHFVLWCKDNFGQGTSSRELEGAITKALSLFWEKSGDTAPKSLEVSVKEPDSEDRMLVRISIAPSRHVLPSGEKAELEFFW